MTPERLQEIENSIGRIECPACGGSGVYLDVPTGNEACDECDGSGMVSQFAPADDLIAEIRRLTAERDEAHSKLVDVLDGYADYLRAFHRLGEAANTLEQQRNTAEATIATLRGELNAERLEVIGAVARKEAAQAENAILREQLEHEPIRLAACGVAAMGNTPEMVEQRIGRDNPAWSASYGDVCAAVDREMALREQLQAAQADTERMDWLDGLADRTEYQNKRVGHRPVSSDMHFDYGRARLYVRNQEGRVVVSGEGTVREAIDAARVKQAHPTPAQEGQEES